jgi:hypothetical protein
MAVEIRLCQALGRIHGREDKVVPAFVIIHDREDEVVPGHHKNIWP